MNKGSRYADITDGTSNTIIFVEARREIPWTKPEDISIPSGAIGAANSPGVTQGPGLAATLGQPQAAGAPGPLPDLGGLHPGGFNAVFADGSVRFIRSTVNPVVLRALFTRGGGEVVSSDSY